MIVFLGFALQGFGQTQPQTCNGALGDPVIKEDFGSGSNPGGPLAAGITDMTYAANPNMPKDGEYTILTNTNNAVYGAWYKVPADHTGNPNGYMMVINASLTPSTFFTQQAHGLCPNTTYEFAAYIFNLITPAAFADNPAQPNITFTIEDAATKLPFPPAYTTGPIPSALSLYTGWVKYSTYFTTPANVTDVQVVMSNSGPGGNGNDFLLDDITFRACGPVMNVGFGTPSLQTAPPVCQGTNVNYTLQANGLSSGAVYYWQVNTGGQWTDIPGQTGSSYQVNIPNAAAGTYQYRVGAENGTSNSPQCRVYSGPATLTVNPLPVVQAANPPPVCFGTPLQLTATGGATYIWTKPDLTTTTQNPLVIPNATMADAGNYSVVAYSAAGCASPPKQVTATVLPAIVAVVNNPSPICSGDQTQLTASGGTVYSWSPSTGLSDPNIANPVAKPEQTTAYAVQIGNGACSVSKDVTVTVYQSPQATAGSNFALFEGQSRRLDGKVSGDDITGYSWSPTTFLDDPNSLTPVATPTDDITYTLKVETKNCGIAISSVFIRLYKKITIPNTFSPNSDGINDNWDIDALITYPDCSVLIFNRYGQQVYQSTGYARPWDGTYNGAPLPPGTYYYIIDLKNNTPKLTGWVLIVR